ncbi:MAG: DNA polymerase III subunit beta [Planctomycetota bacterium]
MKVVCDRDALLDAVNVVSGVVNTRSPKPQLACIRLTATTEDGAGQLTLEATDAEVALRLSILQVTVEEPGAALVPADKLRQIVGAESNEPTLRLEADEATLNIRGADAHFQVFGYPASEFPELPEFAAIAAGTAAGKPKDVFDAHAGTLSTLISKTLFASARENTRYAINGVLLKRLGKGLEMVATDGRRLALCKASLQTVPKGDKDGPAASCIVPAKALGLLQKLAGDPEEAIAVAITDTQAVFAIGGSGPSGDGARATLASSLVEGTFPPYEDVIPKDQDKKATFAKDVLNSAVKRAALLTNEESRGVRMSFRAEAKQLELASRAPEVGEATINVDLPGYDGDDVEIGFNPQFIAEALRVVPEAEVVMELKSSSKPGLLKAGSDFLYVVMPVNLQ